MLRQGTDLSEGQTRRGSLWVGAHLAKGQNLANTIHSIIEMGGNAIQFFLSSPINSGAGTTLKKSEIETAQQLRGQIYLIVHGKYILNFCRPRQGSTEWQFNCLKTDLRQAAQIGADVIIHQGKNLKELGLSPTEAQQTFVNNITAILAETPELENRIILENSCQQGTEMGYTVAQLADIFNLIDPEYRPRIGFCLDLCHLFVSGACDVRSADAVKTLFDDFERLIGFEYLKVIHFNDSRTAFGACNDNHDDLLIGQIGNPHLGGSSAGFKTIVKQAKACGIPMILETPRNTVESSTEAQINLIRTWANGNQDQEAKYITANHTAQAEQALKTPAKKTGQPTCDDSETITDPEAKLAQFKETVQANLRPAPEPQSDPAPPTMKLKLTLKPKIV